MQAASNVYTRSFAMITASEIRSIPWLNGEARQLVMEAFNAVSHWRDEISAANDRCLTKVLDQVVAAQRAQGWPNNVTAATREHLLKASKIQTQVIDQLMGQWEQQLESKDALPDWSMSRMSSTTMDPASEMMRLGEITLTPFKIWLQVAEAWQRSWADAIRGASEAQQARPTQRAA
jgi:hypothetical protein